MSKFDRADPSLDRDYTDGLNANDDSLSERFEPYRCSWCDCLCDRDSDYCSPLCAVHAETDDCER